MRDGAARAAVADRCAAVPLALLLLLLLLLLTGAAPASAARGSAAQLVTATVASLQASVTRQWAWTITAPPQAAPPALTLGGANAAATAGVGAAATATFGVTFQRAPAGAELAVSGAIDVYGSGISGGSGSGSGGYGNNAALFGTVVSGNVAICVEGFDAESSAPLPSGGASMTTAPSNAFTLGNPLYAGGGSFGSGLAPGQVAAASNDAMQALATAGCTGRPAIAPLTSGGGGGGGAVLPGRRALLAFSGTAKLTPSAAAGAAGKEGTVVVVVDAVTATGARVFSTPQRVAVSAQEAKGATARV